MLISGAGKLFLTGRSDVPGSTVFAPKYTNIQGLASQSGLRGPNNTLYPATAWSTAVPAARFVHDLSSGVRRTQGNGRVGRHRLLRLNAQEQAGPHLHVATKWGI